MHRITLIPGDGIGPKSLPPSWHHRSFGVEIEWETHVAGSSAGQIGSTLPDELLESIKRNKVGLKGPITTRLAKALPR